MKKAKKDWIHVGPRCEEIETCLNKNNNKKAYHLLKALTSEKPGGPQLSRTWSGKCLTEEQELFSRWTEYCSEQYNNESSDDYAVLVCSQFPEDLHPYLCEEVEVVVESLNKCKTAGVDNEPAGLVQEGGETMIDI